MKEKLAALLARFNKDDFTSAGDLDRWLSHKVLQAQEACYPHRRARPARHGTADDGRVKPTAHTVRRVATFLAPNSEPAVPRPPSGPRPSPLPPPAAPATHLARVPPAVDNAGLDEDEIALLDEQFFPGDSPERSDSEPHPTYEAPERDSEDAPVTCPKRGNLERLRDHFAKMTPWQAHNAMLPRPPMSGLPGAGNSFTRPEVFDSFVTMHRAAEIEPDKPHAYPPTPSQDVLPALAAVPLVTRAEVRSVLRRLRKDQVPDNLGLTAHAVRASANALAGPLAHLITLCIRTGRVPPTWRTCDWRAMPKPDKPVTLANMRPIAITALFSRITESVLLRRLPTALLRKIIGANQFGFARGCTTTDAIEKALLGVECALSFPSLKNRQPVGLALLVDFSSAFTTVDPASALDRLRAAGVPAYIIAFVEAWLRDRHATMTMEDGSTRRARLTRGVPQGSVFGPLLWCAAMAGLLDDINDASSDVRLMTAAEAGNPKKTDRRIDNVSNAAYADDLTLVVCGTTTAYCVQAMQRLADVVTAWSVKNGVDISRKTELVTLRGAASGTEYNSVATAGEVTMGNVRVTPRLGSFRMLGIRLECTVQMFPPCLLPWEPPPDPKALEEARKRLSVAYTETRTSRRAALFATERLAAHLAKEGPAIDEIENFLRINKARYESREHPGAKFVQLYSSKTTTLAIKRGKCDGLREKVAEWEAKVVAAEADVAAKLLEGSGSRTLSAKPQAAHLIASTRTTTRVLHCLTRILKPTELGAIVESFVYGRLGYGAESWATRIHDPDVWHRLDATVGRAAGAVFGLYRSVNPEAAVRLIGHRAASFEARAQARRFHMKRKHGDVDDPSVLCGVCLEHVSFMVPPEALKKKHFDVAKLLTGDDGRTVTDAAEIARRFQDHPLAKYNEDAVRQLGGAAKVWSTDGSKRFDKSGYAVVRWNGAPDDPSAQVETAKIFHCVEGTVPFRTEHRAINVVLQDMIDLATSERDRGNADELHYAVITDSRSSIDRLRSYNTTEADTRTALTRLGELGRLGVRVSIAFVFSHTSLRANEVADEYAALAVADYLGPKRLREALARVQPDEMTNPYASLRELQGALVLTEEDDDATHWRDLWRLDEKPKEAAADMLLSIPEPECGAARDADDADDGTADSDGEGAPQAQAATNAPRQRPAPKRAPTNSQVDSQRSLVPRQRPHRTKLPNFVKTAPHSRWRSEAFGLTIEQMRALSQARVGVLAIGPPGYTHGEPVECSLCKSANVIGRGRAAVQHAFECENLLVRKVRADLGLPNGFERKLLWETDQKKLRNVAEVVAVFNRMHRAAYTGDIGSPPDIDE